ncbi:hypothetical protein GQ42DRAFT_151901 [Ramicandelaber brevisporus]|nr:hypothetical protein GQ42DRAFT_151901 [Ramicandelaber brevisporus]
MPPRAEGNSFHLTLYSLLARWMPTTIFFSVSGRFILIPDIDKLDSALSAAAAASTAPPHSAPTHTPSFQDQQQAFAPDARFTASGAQDAASTPYLIPIPASPRAGYGGRVLSMGSYSSMRRQLCAYNFYAVEPQTISQSELPEGVVLNSKSRVWFHAHFYRGATSWHNVPRIACPKKRSVRASPPCNAEHHHANILADSDGQHRSCWRSKDIREEVDADVSRCHRRD